MSRLNQALPESRPRGLVDSTLTRDQQSQGISRSLKKVKSSRELRQKFQSSSKDVPPLPQSSMGSSLKGEKQNITTIPQAATPLLRMRKSLNSLRDAVKQKPPTPGPFCLGDLEASRESNKTFDRSKDIQARSTDTSDLTKLSQGISFDSTTASQKKAFRDKTWSEKHMRYRHAVPIIPVIPPFQVKADIESTARRIAKAARDAVNDGRDDRDAAWNALPLVPEIRYATDLSNFSLGADPMERPDGFILPSALLSPQQREDRRSWMRDYTKYGYPSESLHSRDCHLPDLFSRAHDIAARSHGTTIIVTIYRDSLSSISSPTHVYVSPGIAIDLAPLGQAALEFRDRFDHLSSPIAEYLTGNLDAGGLVERESSTTVPRFDPSNDSQDKEGTCDRSGRQGQMSSGSSAIVQDSYESGQAAFHQDSRTITNEETQYIVSQTARAVEPVEPLSPGCHERFTKYGAVFHTHPQGIPRLHEDGQDRFAPKRDAGHDMRIVTALTGGLGITFVFELDPATKNISATIHTSWQFWNLQRYGLLNLAKHIHHAIRPSLVVNDIIKEGIRTAGWSLPRRPVYWDDESPDFGDLEFARYRLLAAIPQAIWRGYPDRILCEAEEQKARDTFCQSVDHCVTPERPIAPPVPQRLNHSPPSDAGSSPPPSPPRPLRLFKTPDRMVLMK